MSAPANRQPHIQGLRALSVLVVVLFHAGLPVPGGFIGVDAFFVISGYVITAMLQRELEATGRVDFARFYIRRFKRLTPALALTVAATVIAAAFVLSPLGAQQQTAKTALGAMGLAANWAIAGATGGYFDARAETNPLLNIWSLSVEEQFYLGFPLLMLLAWAWARRTGRPAHVKAVVAVVGLASFALAVTGSGQPDAPFAVGFYSPFTRAWEFAAGALLALSRQPRWTRQGGIVVQSLGLGLFGFSLWEITASTPFPGPMTLLPVIATLLLISAGGRSGTGIGAVLSSRPMVRIGDWSYSIYLWHWPCIVLASVLFPRTSNIAVFAAVVSLVPALLSYHFVEQPIRGRDYPARRLAALVLTTVLVPVALALGLWRLADVVWMPKVKAVSTPADARAMHAGYTQGCHYEPGDGASDPEPCVWNPEQSGTPVYLLGDSNAAQFVEALIDATAAAHSPLSASTSSGCPLLDIRMDGPAFPGYGPSCLERNRRLLTWLQRAVPGTVFIAASNDYWYESGWTLTDPSGATTSDPDAMLRMVGASLERVVRQVQDAGHRVVLVQAVPHWVPPFAWDPLSCSLSDALAGCVQTMPSAFDLARTKAAREMVSRVAAATRATLLDVTDAVCPDGECVTSTAELPVYRDSTHITVAMSHALAPRFLQALAR